MPKWDPKRFEWEQLLRGAVASVSLSHATGCSCDICKAGRGDEAALVRVQEAQARA